MLEAATIGDRGCNHICARGCNHMRPRLQPYAPEAVGTTGAIVPIQVLALWVGVDVPPDARADVYRGVVLLRDLSNPNPDSHPDPIPIPDLEP